MKRKTLQVGSYGVNCSLLVRGSSAWIVDPGAEPERIVESLAREGLEPAIILLTHAHFDHIGAVNALQDRFPGLPLYLHPDDTVMLTHPLNRCPPDYPGLSAPRDIRDVRTLADVTVLETPGHTPGGCCYLFPAEKLLLSGDTLFAGSVGRTDFPGGSMTQLMASLEKLTALPDDTTVVPGHGPETTIGTEKRQNPFLT